MHLEVLIDEFPERHRRAAPSGTQPLDDLLKRLLCLSATCEPTNLRPRRAATLEPIPLRPKRFTARALRLQLEHLTLLHHHRTSSIDNEIEESEAERARPDDHLSQTEVVGAAEFAVVRAP